MSRSAFAIVFSRFSCVQGVACVFGNCFASACAFWCVRFMMVV